VFRYIRLSVAEVIKDEAAQKVRILLPGVSKIGLKDIVLPPAAKYECRLLITGGQGYENGVYQVAVRQIFEGLEVGRVTWELRAFKDSSPTGGATSSTSSSCWCWVIFILFIILLIWFILTLLYFLTRGI
jgi:hypothetical protein